MKKVSVYVKGDRNSTAYYRIYQYLDNIDGIQCKYRMMMSPTVHNRYMPISKQPIFVKVLVYIHIYCRMLWALLCDLRKCPDVIVIHRRIISRFMPLSYRLLLSVLKKRGARIIWDFDDNIIESGEVSKGTFTFYSEMADKIIVTHNALKELVNQANHSKVNIMPTTDGDMYKLFQNSAINNNRLTTLEDELVLVWVATSSNLKYLEEIVPFLDDAAEDLIKRGKVVRLLVVCDQPLVLHCSFLTINNIKWSRDKAIDAMCQGHIGIMPLKDNEFTRGKGGFKLVQYMSVGLPSIGSNVGFNAHVLAGGAGILVNNLKDWRDAIITLSTPRNWVKYSNSAYDRWCQEFSYDNNLNKWKTIV